METNQRFEFIVSTLIRFRKLWIIPPIVGMLLAGVYVFALKTNTWTAKQSLIVRDDLLGESYKPGQFNSQESMKSAQETILEIARKPEVIRNTLKQLGPVKKSWLGDRDSYPSDEVVEDVQGLISFSAPNGGEFGRTETIILHAKSTSPERSRQFIEILLDEVDKKVSEVRSLRLQSMAEELTRIRDAAAISLQESSEKLREMEKFLGSDVSTMHGLNSASAGEGIKREISQIRLEKRLVEAELESARNSQEMVITARLNPEKTLATSTEFLSSQPTLKALQQSLVEAQKNYAVHVGLYQPNHPLVISSRETIVAMRNQIYLELETLERSVASRIKILENKISRLSQLEYEENERLAGLGTTRVDHLTLNAEVAKKTELVNNAYSKLAEIEALRNAAPHVNWLTRLDAPQVSTRPDGLGKKHTIVAGGICGLMFGIGLVMLVAPPMVSPHQGRPGRRTDLPRRGNENKLEEPTLNEIVGPTAASAIQTASAATAATVGKGVSLAKSAFGSYKDQPSDSVNLPHVQRRSTEQEQKVAPKPEPTFTQNSGGIGNPGSGVPNQSATATNQTHASDAAEAPSHGKVPSKQQSPAEILAEVRATAVAKQNKSKASPQSSAHDLTQIQQTQTTAEKTNEGNRSIKLDSSRAAKIQRVSNTRPVDLIKSAEVGNASFVQIPPREEATTQPIDDYMATIQPVDQPAEDTDTPVQSAETKAAPTENSENPFLKNLPTRRLNPTTDDSQQTQDKSRDEANPPAENQTSSTPVVRPDSPTMPIPDQIKNLADSISKFAKPLENPPKKKGDPNF